jgi:hypothetical protein
MIKDHTELDCRGEPMRQVHLHEGTTLKTLELDPHVRELGVGHQTREIPDDLSVIGSKVVAANEVEAVLGVVHLSEDGRAVHDEHFAFLS